MNDNKESIHFLCVGVDPNFISYLLTSTKQINVSLDTCRTIQDAREKIASYDYDVYILDLSLTELPVLAFVEEIRSHSTKKCAIAVILEVSFEHDRLRMLKLKDDVDFVLQKPIYPQQIDNLLMDIRKIQQKPEESVERDFQVLRQNYEKTIYNKIETLMSLVESVQQEPTLEHVTELKETIHKIGGSAGSYGYPSVSALCKEMVIEISNKISSQSFDNKEWLNSLDEFIKKVKFCFQTSTYQEPQKILIHTSLPRPTLYVIDNDIAFLELLKRVSVQFPLELFVESNPQLAIEQLRAVDFNPQAMIINQEFENSSIKAFDLIEIQRSKMNRQATLFALLLEKDNVDIRIEAMQKGVDYIFRKPVSAYILLKSMNDALEIKSLSHIKVLILDDDTDFCSFVIAALTEIGVTVRAIHDSSDLFKTLEEFNPNILLLDLVLPKYNGLNVLKTLRQDMTYNNLIIVIVTSSEETSTSVSAYSANADDILYKPLDRTILQKRIISLSERQLLSQDLLDQNYTGLDHLKALLTELHECLIKSGRSDHHLALFEIANFKDWILQNGHAAAKNLLIAISNQLQWEADQKMKCYSYNSSVFAIVFEEGSLKNIEVRMYNFLKALSKRENNASISFICSIIPLSKQFGNAQDLLKAAEKGLIEANRIETGPIKIQAVFPKGESQDKKEVIIIDSDQDLLNILKQAFESHGLVVKTFLEGGEALKELYKRGEELLPSLMIAERNLPDMDGMDLYLKLKNRFRAPPPLFILTVFSSDKDVSEGIRQGVLEYIIKPFNISILVQKALKVIFSG